MDEIYLLKLIVSRAQSICVRIKVKIVLFENIVILQTQQHKYYCGSCG